jgi:hypothetical protein
MHSSRRVWACTAVPAAACMTLTTVLACV